MSKSFKYVSDFEFPSECGFTGSAGKTHVKGYARGGEVKPAVKTPVAANHGMQTSAAAHARNAARQEARVAAKPAVAATPAKPAVRATPAVPAKPAMKYGGKVMKKADGGSVLPEGVAAVADRPDVVVNTEGQRLFASRPAPLPLPPAPAPVPVVRKNRRQLRKEMQDKLHSLDRNAADYRTQTRAIKTDYNTQMRDAPRYKEGGVARKSYPTNKSEPMIKGKKCA